MREVEIIDLLGQRVLSKTVFDKEECLIEVGSLVPGVYFVRAVGTNGDSGVVKLIKN